MRDWLICFLKGPLLLFVHFSDMTTSDRDCPYGRTDPYGPSSLAEMRASALVALITLGLLSVHCKELPGSKGSMSSKV